jgi:hypothetical protein
MEEWTSASIGSLWDRIKQTGSRTASKRTNRRQEREFSMALKPRGLADVEIRQAETQECVEQGEMKIQW